MCYFILNVFCPQQVWFMAVGPVRVSPVISQQRGLLSFPIPWVHNLQSSEQLIMDQGHCPATRPCLLRVQLHLTLLMSYTIQYVVYSFMSCLLCLYNQGNPVPLDSKRGNRREAELGSGPCLYWRGLSQALQWPWLLYKWSGLHLWWGIPWWARTRKIILKPLLK